MAVSLTVADLRKRIETDFEEEVVQRIIDSVLEEIDRVAGPEGSVTDWFTATGAEEISLSRKPSSITEIKERAFKTSDEVTLSANDYRQMEDYRLRRLASGDNAASSWGAEVQVTYTVDTDSNLRERVALDLAQLDIEFQAAEQSSDGDHSESQATYAARRAALLDQIREGRSPVL